ncbi:MULTISPECIES: hypothetical protein [Burkholderiaceae]|uniref:hypothetical protein n=1 Tax=Burkholderiaceae TaxID=119060 RepID=UPI000A79C733|nr:MULTISPECIES: hypothetical protein [Burkholderiaceae]
MNSNRLCASLFGVVVAVAAQQCMAQSDTSQSSSVAEDSSTRASDTGTAPRQPSAVAGARTRDEVTRELAGFRGSEQEANMRELYRGN